MGYQVVPVSRKDGRKFDQVVAREGCGIKVRGHSDVPFQPDEASIQVNHRHWNFRAVERTVRTEGANQDGNRM